MILSFKVSNFKSFNETQELNFLTQPRQSGLNNNYAQIQNKKILKSAVIFGANASGKSNLIKALEWFKDFVINSFQPTQEKDEKGTIIFEEFLLNYKNKNLPLELELEFLIENQHYKYSFAATKTEIIKEKLNLIYQSKKTKTNGNIYQRTKNKLEIYKPNKIRNSAQNILKKDTLFLTVLAASGDTLAKKVMAKISSIAILNSLENSHYTRNNYIEYKKEIDDLILQADFGIKNINIKDEDVSKKEIEKLLKMEKDLPPRLLEHLKNNSGKLKKSSVLTTHHGLDKNNQNVEIEFDLEKESDGTQKTFALAGIVADILKQGKFLVIDELESNLHSFICKFILLQFHLKNPNNAQLLFTSHSTSLLDKDLLRRDQIWFAEKNEMGATQLYSLAGLSERKDVDYAQRYLEGRYGAVPYISLLENYQDENA
jgi:AAA15 family ATPase/GTPase